MAIDKCSEEFSMMFHHSKSLRDRMHKKMSKQELVDDLWCAYVLGFSVMTKCFDVFFDHVGEKESLKLLSEHGLEPPPQEPFNKLNLFYDQYVDPHVEEIEKILKDA